MIVKLLSEHHLVFLSLTGGCRGSSEHALVKMSNCWKSHAAAHMVSIITQKRNRKIMISVMMAVLFSNDLRHVISNNVEF